MFGKVRLLRYPVKIELMTKRSVLNSLTYCATLLEDKFGKDSFYDILVDFVVCFDK